MTPDLAALLVARLARELQDCRHVAVGALSPLPGAAALLARARSGGRLRVSVLGSHRHNPFTNGGVELFDCAAQGRIDAFFLGGGQIDGEANLNLVGTGEYPRTEVRFPGSFGSAFMYFHVPRVILFREEHTPRVLVPRVDFVSAPGTSPPGTWRRGGPRVLVTAMACFTFEPERRRFRLDSVHPGHDVEEVVSATGFDFDRAATVRRTPAPDAATLALLRDRVAPELRRLYPRFVDEMLGGDAAREAAAR